MLARIGSIRISQNVARTREHLSLALELQQKGLNSVVAANTGMATPLVFLEWGQRGPAEQAWKEISQAALRSNDATGILRSLVMKVVLKSIDGDLHGALDEIELMLVQASEAGALVVGQQYARNWLPRLLLSLGKPAEALSRIGLADEAAGVATETVWVTGFRALCLAHSGQLALAKEAMEEAARDYLSDADSSPATLLVEMLEVAVLLKDDVSAAKYARTLAPLASWVTCQQAGITCAGRHLGAAAQLLGRPDEARGYYDQALEVCGKLRFRPEIALTRLELAGLLLDHYADERSTAIGHLDFAIAEFRDMKMQPSLERALRHRELLKA
jgi:tetratricopeptide (TPR) repeat protein